MQERSLAEARSANLDPAPVENGQTGKQSLGLGFGRSGRSALPTDALESGYLVPVLDRGRESQPSGAVNGLLQMQRRYGNRYVQRVLGAPNGSEAGDGDSVDASTAEPLAGSLPGAPSACVLNAALPFSRSGIIRSAGGTVGEQFEVRAEWRSDPPFSRGETSYCAAECGEYHQFIKGHMLSSPNADGSGLTDVSGKMFGGAALDENVFREDGLDDNANARYGHRDEGQTMDEKYEPDRATGPKYAGRDFPRVMIGTFADIDVTFLGKLVDTCNNTDNQSATWRVQYRGVIRP
jgi:hypothetical protein